MRLDEIKKENLPSVETLTPSEIAKHHKVPLRQIISQMKKGIRVEYEHAKDYKTAREIALDHLKELPDYYTRLAKMEKQGKKNG